MRKGNLEVRKDNWVDPRIRDLELRDTLKEPGIGGDGQTIYPDCTKS